MESGQLIFINIFKIFIEYQQQVDTKKMMLTYRNVHISALNLQ